MKELSFNPSSKYCLNCGSPQLRGYSAWASDTIDHASVSIQECGACSFAWQYPLGRNLDESRQFFESAYSGGKQGTNDYFDPAKKRQVAALELEFAAHLPCIGRKLLDIGAGSGVFAQVAADAGWDVTAVDPALDCARLAGSPRVRAIKGDLENIPYGSTFDFVTLWDVIEHAGDPIDLIAQATHYVGNSGWLVIETGNFKSADRILGGREHWMYQLDHRWYFSPESIAKLLREAGFTELVFSQKVLRPGWKGSPQYSVPSIASLLKSMLRRPMDIRKTLRLRAELQRAKTWELSGIGIFAVAGRRSSSHN